jgi:hypothetical protein
MELGLKGSGGVDWIVLPKERESWAVLVNAVINSSVL